MGSQKEINIVNVKIQTSILKEEEPTETTGAAYTNDVARIAISACVAWPEARLSCWLKSCWLLGRHRMYFWIWSFFPVCEYQDDVSLSVAGKNSVFSRMREKKLFNERREKERSLIVLASLFPLLMKELSAEKNTRPIDCDCLTYLSQPLDSFLLFSPLSISMYFPRKPSIIEHFRSKPMRPVQWMEIYRLIFVHSIWWIPGTVLRKWWKLLMTARRFLHFSDDNLEFFSVLRISITIPFLNIKSRTLRISRISHFTNYVSSRINIWCLNLPSYLKFLYEVHLSLYKFLVF